VYRECTARFGNMSQRHVTATPIRKVFSSLRPAPYAVRTGHGSGTMVPLVVTQVRAVEPAPGKGILSISCVQARCFQCAAMNGPRTSCAASRDAEYSVSTLNPRRNSSLSNLVPERASPAGVFQLPIMLPGVLRHAPVNCEWRSQTSRTTIRVGP
jgi:hypothetical protein